MERSAHRIGKQYTDVLALIRKLTGDVEVMSCSIESLKVQTQLLKKDVDDIKRMVLANNTQIVTLTSSLQVLTSEVGNIKTAMRDADQFAKEQSQKLTELKSDFGRQRIIANGFWALFLVIFGALLSYILVKSFG
jgi:chromosome segregation ATPase